MVTVGSSRYTYEVIENWGSLPEAGLSATWHRWRWIPRTGSTPSNERSRPYWCSTARATSSTPGVTGRW